MTADPAWMSRGSCRELPPTIFFPEDGAGVELACEICWSCPVREACLEFAIRHGLTHGVWGGISERGRRRLARARQLD